LKRHCNILKFYISVGTPADEDGSADLKYVLTVARDSRKHLNDHMLVVTENAVPGPSKGKRAMQEELDKRYKNRI
jgi:UDPglucose 6-dehydrogenase